ncbi:hypothetical protein Ga0100231_005820 [Opitutaceae bacterium TAV4]|nr:hypothetical protein Ga0100231_005820 [Opitutaceae bacterium TAV4]RRK02495.1 hypothetical protein Ga0100230_005035 [Opitutaceae bacterium TAV3]
MTPARFPRLALFLVISVAANAALVGYVALRPSVPSAVTGDRAKAAAIQSGSPRAAARQRLPAADALAAAVSTDLPTYTENLRKAGVPDRLVRAIINAEINDRFREREEALRPKRREFQYWENQHNYYENDGVTLDQRLALIDLRREKAALRKELLGDAPNTSGKPDNNPIPSEKREATKQIAEDYGAMMEHIRREARGYMLPSDEEKVKYLEAERRRELAQILTPEEMREYDLRNSQTTQQMRWDLVAFGPAEEEFRAIHELRSEFDRDFPHRNNAGQEYWKQRNAAEEAMNAQLKVVLGEERYKDYERSQDWEFRQLRQLTNRLGLEPTAATQLYDLRDTTAQAARQIIDAKDMDLATKRESLKLLAEQTREQITGQLGQEGGEAFIKGQNNWLDEVSNGRVRYKVGPRSYSYKSLPPESEAQPKPKATPQAKK